MVAKKLLEEIISRFGLPVSIGSDNRPAFVSKIEQGLASALGTKWKLRCEYSPQSSGQGERMNRTLKETLTKLAVETGRDWVSLLPFVLFRVHNSPYKLGLTPFEIVYRSPPPICPVSEGKSKPPHLLHAFQQEMLALSKLYKHIWSLIRIIYESQNEGTIPSHDIGPGDWVWVKRHQRPWNQDERALMLFSLPPLLPSRWTELDPGYTAATHGRPPPKNKRGPKENGS